MATVTYVVVQPGDRIDTIAKRVYGNPNLYYKLVAANPRLDIWAPRPGLRIEVPRA